MEQKPHRHWPNGHRFAFTIFDDPDRHSVENVGPVYELLEDLGMRTTLAVWPRQGTQKPTVGGTTCADPTYLAWVLDKQRQGFEIGLHNTTYHTSTREETQAGLKLFAELFGYDPASMANHTGCDEGIYWGAARLSSWRRLVYQALTRRWTNRHRGHVESSSLFWGDICRAHVKYVRNFTTTDINTLKTCPVMPYYDVARPYVNGWFASTEGPYVRSFNERLCEKNQDQLVQEGGACIMYTHFAMGFCERGRVNPRFKALMTRLSKLNGWFVPVRTLLDHLSPRGPHVLTWPERSRLERQWLWTRMINGRT